MITEHTALTGPAVDDFARRMALKKLYLVRRYAAKLLYELDLHHDVRADGRRSYASHLARAYGFALDDAGNAYLVRGTGTSTFAVEKIRSDSTVAWSTAITLPGVASVSGITV